MATEPIAPGAVDFLLDADGDIALFADGALRFVFGAEAIAQGARIRFGVWRGEWFGNLNEGIPMIQTLVQTGVSLTTASAVYRRALQVTPGIAAVESVTVSRVSPRTLAVAWVARKVTGGILRSSDFKPFVVPI